MHHNIQIQLWYALKAYNYYHHAVHQQVYTVSVHINVYINVWKKWIFWGIIEIQNINKMQWKPMWKITKSLTECLSFSRAAMLPSLADAHNREGKMACLNSWISWLKHWQNIGKSENWLDIKILYYFQTYHIHYNIW